MGQRRDVAMKRGRGAMMTRAFIIPIKLRVGVAAALIFGACATTAPSRVESPSGRPEIQIVAPKKLVADTVANAYSAGGWTVKNANEYSIVVERPAEGLTPALLYGSRFNSTPSVRVTFSFSEIGNVTQVLGRVEMVTNPGSAFEKISDVSANAIDLHRDLQALKARLESGAVGIIVGSDMRITGVAPGGPAATAGLQIGDRIVWVRDQPVGTQHNAQELLSGPVGEIIEVRIVRDGTQLSFRMTRMPYADVYRK